MLLWNHSSFREYAAKTSNAILHVNLRIASLLLYNFPDFEMANNFFRHRHIEKYEG